MAAFIVVPVNRSASINSANASSFCSTRSYNVNRRLKPAVTLHTGRPCRSTIRKITMADKSEEEETVSLQDMQARLAKTSETPTPTTEAGAQPEDGEGEDLRTEEQKEIDRLRAAEKFIEVDEGKYECTGCGFVYDPVKGDSRNDIPTGTKFEDIPESYTCGQCRTPKRKFLPLKKVIAGFADNQTYGFGSNTMTGGEKSLLIFGGLAFCFLLLLSGYAMN